ncbi:MAG: Mu transposase C-terminal domain-containing protein [Candidatus Brocadiia bacterium]
MAMRLLSQEEVLEVVDFDSPRTLRRHVRGDGWRRVQIGEHSSNGQPIWGYVAADLPAAAREKLKAKKGGQGSPPVPTADAGPAPAPASEKALAARASSEVAGWVPVTDGHLNFGALEDMGLEEKAEKARRLFRAIARAKRLIAENGGKDVTAIKRAVAAGIGLSESAFYRWWRRYEVAGSAGLVDGRGGRRGDYSAIPEELQRKILDAYLNGRSRSVAEIWRHVVAPHFEGGQARMPSYSAVRRFIENEVSPLLETVARQGERAYKERCAPRVARDYSVLSPNEWWTSDNRLGDNLVLVSDGQGQGWSGYEPTAPCPCGSGKARKRCCSARRVWWTVTFDVASAAIVSWSLALRPDSSTIAQNLRRGILDFGLPENWLRDNGSDYGAKRIAAGADPRDGYEDAGGLPLEQQSMLGALGVQVHSATPYSGWAKPAESFFSSLARHERLIPAYVGRSTEDRPEQLKRDLARGDILTLEEYRQVIEVLIERWNGREDGIGHRDRGPLAFYEGFEPERVRPETLTFLLQRRGDYMMRQGMLKVDGRRYMPARGQGFLGRFEGAKLPVRYDPQRPDTIFVTADGQVFEIPEAPAAIWGDFNESNKRAKHLGKAQRGYVRGVAARVKGALSDEEADPLGAYALVRDRKGSGVPALSDGQGELPEPVRQQIEARLGGEDAEEPEEEHYIDEYVRRLNARLESQERRRAGGKIEPTPEPPSEPLDAIGVAKQVTELEENGYGEPGRGRWSAADLAVALADGLGVSIGSRQPLEREKRAARAWCRACLSTPAGARALKAADARVRAVLDWAEALPNGRGDLSDLARWVRQLRDGREEDVPAGQVAVEDAILALADLAERTWSGTVGVDAAVEAVGEPLEALRVARRDGLLADAPDELLAALAGVGLVPQAAAQAAKGAAA